MVALFLYPLSNFLLLFSLIFCFSCQSPKQKYPKEKILRINLTREPTTLDPRKAGDLTSCLVDFILFEGLCKQSPQGGIELSGCSFIEVSEDKKTYTFIIETSLWSNGEPVTAYDYERSWKTVLDPSFPALNAHLFYPILNAEEAKKGLVPLDEIGVIAKNEKILCVTLKEPTPHFLQLLTFCTFFPAHQSMNGLGPSSNQKQDLISNGPFQLSLWKHNDEIHVKKNPYYQKKDSIDLDGIKMLMVGDESSALHLYEKGELDIIGAPTSHLPADALVSISRKKQFHNLPAAGTMLCIFNTETFPFSNVNMRKAFALAIHRKEITSHVTQLGEQIATGLIPPILRKHDRSFFVDGDDNMAKSFLEKGMQELGITLHDLQGITYSYSAAETNHLIAQTLQQQWLKTLGIKVKLEHSHSKVLLDSFARGNFQLGQFFLFAQYFDPMNFLERFKHKTIQKNFPHWESQSFIQLLEKSTYQKNPHQRALVLEEAEEEFMNSMPVAPIFYSSSACLIKPYLRNVTFTPMGSIYFEKIAIDLDKKYNKNKKG